MSNAIRQEVSIEASPQRVYDALLDARRFREFTGAPAEIDPSPGGAFACFGGIVTGRNIELVPNRRIVQAWRATNWPAGHFSIVTFDLKPTRAGTLLTFTHIGIPARRVRSIDYGWKNYYWKPIKAALERKST